MNLVARFRQFLDFYARKDLASISAMLAPDVTLRDWNIAVRGQQAVEQATRQNFQDAATIAIDVLSVYERDGAVAGELRIVVDGTIELFVVDVIDFDGEGRIKAIRSYKGRGD